MLRNIFTNRIFSLTFIVTFFLFIITIISIYFKAEPLLQEPKHDNLSSNLQQKVNVHDINAAVTTSTTDSNTVPTTSITTGTSTNSISSKATDAVNNPQFREDGQEELSEVEQPIIISNNVTDNTSLAIVKDTKSSSKVTLANLNNPYKSVVSDDSLDNYSYCEAKRPILNNYAPVKSAKLISLHLLTRHGDRSPTKFLPLGKELTSWNCPSETSQIQPNDTKYLKRTVTYDANSCTGNKKYCAVSPFKPFMWPGTCTSGQLTAKGSKQHLELGKSLNSIYIQQLQFLKEDGLSDIYVRSTDYQRTQQSAQSLLTGLFPKSLKKGGRIEMAVLPKQLETLYGNPKYCPKLAKLEKDLLSSEIYKNLLKSAEPTRTTFDNILEGKRLDDNVDNFDYFVDIFQARQCNGFPKVCKAKKEVKDKQAEAKDKVEVNKIANRDVHSNTTATNNRSDTASTTAVITTTTTSSNSSPTNATASTQQSKPKVPDCVEQEFIDKMMVYANAQVRLTFRDHPLNFPTLARLRIGGYLMELKRNLLLQASKAAGEELIDLKDEEDPNFTLSNDGEGTMQFSNRKLTYHSAHDTTLALVLGALHSDEMRWPPYAANLIVELWVKEGDSNWNESDASNQSSSKKDKLDAFQIRFLYNGKLLTLPWCKSGLCPLSSLLNYLDSSLGLVAGFEKYGKFARRADSDSKGGNSTTTTTTATSVKRWRYLDECWLD